VDLKNKERTCMHMHHHFSAQSLRPDLNFRFSFDVILLTALRCHLDKENNCFNKDEVGSHSALQKLYREKMAWWTVLSNSYHAWFENLPIEVWSKFFTLASATEYNSFSCPRRNHVYFPLYIPYVVAPKNGTSSCACNTLSSYWSCAFVCPWFFPQGFSK
jgi:hypothetical protein